MIRKMSNDLCKVAVCQFTSTNKKDVNLRCVQELISAADQKHARMVFLPEGCDYIATSEDESKALAETLDGPLMNDYRSLAEKHSLWLSIGGFHEKNKNSDKLNNCHVLINHKGEIVSVYRKTHLFDVELPEKHLNLKESKYSLPGPEIVAPIETPAGKLALSICYDLRFPELSTILRKLDAGILTYPSAFTVGTGTAHWETLLRARAIENQCYVIASAQYGKHNEKRVSYGQAMIIDPWGTIIAQCPKYNSEKPVDESIAIATIDPKILTKIRREMPVFQHRRDDLYNLTAFPKKDMASDSRISHYMFATKVIPISSVFHVSKLSFAFTNIRCVVPGHVLVSSIRIVKRLQDLTPEESADLFQTSIKVQKVVEKFYNCQASCLCIQDGKDSGQTVPHVHCHILPRKVDDFKRNDDIYAELGKHDHDDSRPIRNIEEMSKEATELRKVFNEMQLGN